ncbi:zinc finger protein ZAT1-like [Panicum miliaceum]|uniref:Zinc finger protein ZAT1-like n=1 Tax=Panicum miliaceum TaxID=4540 RepID=A0A3L6TR50_PANMI|nr:zinc finger protein ZAT1-like [Panicum miliaceum]
MRAHARHERKMVAKEASRESNGYSDHKVVVPTPVMLTYGIEEVNAARVLLMISGYSGMDEDFEMDGNSAYCVQNSDMELDYCCHGKTGDAELIMPESPSSDVKLKFSSLSQVLKATESHDCKLCGKVLTSSKGLASHKKFHKVPDHEKVAASRNSAVSQTGQQLLEVDSRLLCLNLNLPGFSDRNYRSRSAKSAQTPWWTTRAFRSERMMGVV